MRELAIFATISFTVVLALAIGVGLGFTFVNLVLHLMGHRPKTQPAAATLQPAEVSGD